jgi:hypothetical protein
MKQVCAIALTLLSIAAVPAMAADEGKTLEVKLSELSQSVLFARTPDKGWAATWKGPRFSLPVKGEAYTVDGLRWSLQEKPGSGYAFTLPDGETLVAEQKGEKIKVARKGKPWLEVKVTTEKIKVYSPENETNEWDLKFKGDKIKVSRGNVDLGRVKYHPDTGKLKAKNPDGTEIAVCKGGHKLSAFVAPFLMRDAPVEQTMFLSLLVLSLDR